METIIIAIIFLILFLVFREAVCWYWKLNAIANTLTKILKVLEEGR